MTRLHIMTAVPVRLAALALAIVLALAPAPARAQGVTSALSPAYGFVAPGAEFDLDFVVPYSGALFNGFKAVFQYDPAVLTYVPVSPVSAQQGCLMTGLCSGACGLTFQLARFAADSIAVDNSLLCNQVFLSGPGQLYRLHFRAAVTDTITYVTLRRAVFLNGGIYVTPVSTANSRIVIGSPLAVDGTGRAPAALRLSAEPNPTHGAVAFSIAAAHDGLQTMDVLDLSGRLVRHLSAGWQPSGTRRLAWDGTGAGGERLAAGVYLVRLRSGPDVAFARVAMVP